MTGTNALEHAWAAAQTRLAAIQSLLGSSNPQEQRIVRVGQLDAELLDLELAQILQEPISRALSFINVCWSLLDVFTASELHFKEHRESSDRTRAWPTNTTFAL